MAILTEAGRELDALVAEKVMGLDVRGAAFAIHVEGEWSVRGDYEPDADPSGWMCYAGKEPVYCRRDPPMPKPSLDEMVQSYATIGREREYAKRHYDAQLAEWQHDQERWGCHRYDLDVVPHYSTDIAAAWEVVEKMKERHSVTLLGGPNDEGGCEDWVCSVKSFGYRRFQDQEWSERAPTAPLAICRAALKVCGDTGDSRVR